MNTYQFSTEYIRRTYESGPKEEWIGSVDGFEVFASSTGANLMLHQTMVDAV